MIDEIHVQNIALIRDIALELSPGLTAITGETGAGKTALLSACKLLMGARADKTSVREGEKEARVEGRFFIGDTAAPEEREFVVCRRLSADGRSRVTVNGTMAGVGELASLVGPSIDLCGQHEHQELMSVARHVAMLDDWAADDIAEARGAYRVAYDAARAARERYDAVCSASGASEAALEEARFVLAQIEAVDPQEGEYEDILAYLTKAEHAETLARCAHTASEALSSEAGALDALETARSALAEAGRYDESLDSYARSLQESVYVVEDIARDVAGYVQDIDFDGEELASLQERAAAFQGLMRSYGPRMVEVFERRRAAEETIAAVDSGEERLAEATRALEEAEAALAVAADALHSARAAAAPRFAEDVTAVMARLEMGSAALTCGVEMKDRDGWNATGPDAVEFLFAAGKDLQPRPLVRIASGGEISRVMLAVKAVMGNRDAVDTLVFDEVDAGVGGATAVALAGVLAELAKTHQVIVVTHLGQVAAAADVQYVAEKSDDALPETTITEVAGDAREAEIARMISGDVTEASLANAREMLARAQGE